VAATVAEVVTDAAAAEIAGRSSKNSNPCGDWNLRKGSFFCCGKIALVIHYILRRLSDHVGV
jgi:hypothetical protein